MNVTDGAFDRIHKILKDDNHIPENASLRVYVTGGGCSGFQYGFSIEKTIDEEDTIIDRNGARVLIDAISMAYLEGATLDYKTGLEGERFVIDNPNATKTCGCGSSFTT